MQKKPIAKGAAIKSLGPALFVRLKLLTRSLLENFHMGFNKSAGDVFLAGAVAV